MPLAPVRAARRNPDGTVTITLWDGKQYPREEYIALAKKHGIRDTRDPRDWDPIAQTWNDPTPEEPSWM